MTSTRILAFPYTDIKNPFSVDEGGAYAEYMLSDPESSYDIVLGSSILIKDKRDNKDIWFVAEVVSLSTLLPFEINRENQLYVEDENTDPNKILAKTTGPHSIQRMIIKVRLLHEMLKSDKGGEKFVHGPIQRPPSFASYLFFPEVLQEENEEDPSLQDMLNIKDNGLEFGAVGFGNTPYENNNKFLIYKWDLKELDNKHIFIVGESGSGKTAFLKNLAAQIRLNNKDTKIIMTDLQGDISQLLLSDIIASQKPSGWQERIKQPKINEALDALKPFQLVIPYSTRVQENVKALRDLAKKRGVTIKEIGLRLQDLSEPSDVEYLFRVASEQVATLLDEEAETLKINKKKVTLAALREIINKRLGSENKDQIASSGGTPYYKSTYYAALRALKTLGEHFDNHQDSMSLTENPLDCFNFEGTTILFLEHLDSDQRLMWEMQLVKWLYNKKREMGNTFVFFDEAHQIVPAHPSEGSGSGTFYRLRRSFEDLAREGRKFGINLILSTQSPKDLHEIVPEQCSTRIVMKIDPKNGGAAFLTKEDAYMVNKFSKGQFLLYSPFNGSADWIKIHAWMPALPHESMNRFWDKLREQAKREC